MALNIFFDNMNEKLELVLIGLFLLGVYLFILRKYNALGLRLFVLCFMLFIASCTWLYKDEVRLSRTITQGEEYVATVTGKSIVGTKKDNEVELTFTTKDGRTVNTKTSTYVSKPEWDRFEAGKPLSVLYVAGSQETIVQQSIMRFKGDKIYLYYFSGFWLVLGLVLLYTLRNYKVGVDDRGNEWVVKPDGAVILDERSSQAYRTGKRLNIISKLVQSFGK